MKKFLFVAAHFVPAGLLVSFAMHAPGGFGMRELNSLLSFVLSIVALMLIGLILLQEGCGGNLIELNGKLRAIEGVRNPIRRATGCTAAVFFVLTIACVLLR